LLAAPIVPILLLPRDSALGAQEKTARGDWRDVLRDRSVVGAMIATALISASHTLLNTFGAIQFTAMGLSGTTIGILVALSIAAEIVVLFIAQRLLGKRSPLWLIAIGGVIAVFRWICMALHPGLYALTALQLLSGITGMGVITGLMLFIAQRVDERLISTAQGINAVVLGALAALATVASGYAWHGLGYNSYLLAALVAAFGAALTMSALWKQR
jgi:PPP family 3-phenylpropionic acid transporter